jgi:aldose 1-epimerase
LAGIALDDVYTDLTPDAKGNTEFWFQGKQQKVSVVYGPKYPVAVVYAPPGRSFLCFEPMTGVTNVFNLAHQGKFPLQSVPAGGNWRESFWIRPSGF